MSVALDTTRQYLKDLLGTIYTPQIVQEELCPNSAGTVWASQFKSWNATNPTPAIFVNGDVQGSGYTVGATGDGYGLVTFGVTQIGKKVTATFRVTALTDAELDRFLEQAFRIVERRATFDPLTWTAESIVLADPLEAFATGAALQVVSALERGNYDLFAYRIGMVDYHAVDIFQNLNKMHKDLKNEFMEHCRDLRMLRLQNVSVPMAVVRPSAAGAGGVP